MTKANVAVKKNNLPVELMADMVADAGQGLENFDKSDLSIPFLKMAEKMSPEVDKQDGKYIEGLEPGMLYNSVTGEFYENVNIIALHYERKEIEWRPKSMGGGLVAIHEPSAGMLSRSTRDHEGKDILDNGHQLVVTGQHYILVEGTDGWYPAVLSSSSTRLTVTKKWNSQIANRKIQTSNGAVPAPMFSSIWNISTAAKSNDKGSWNVPVFAFVKTIDDAALYSDAKARSTSVKAGEVKVKYEDEDPSANEKDDDNF